MAQQQITAVGNSPAVVLPQELLDQMGVHIGDTIDIAVIDGMLIVSPLQETEREQKIQDAIRQVFARRKSAYQQLA